MLNQVRIRIIAVCLLIPVFLGLYFIETYDWRPGLVSIAFGSTAASDGMSALLSNLTPDQENVVQLEHVSFVDPEADGANGGGVEAELTQEGKRAAEAKEAEKIVAEQTAAEQIAAEKATTEQIAAEEKAAESRAAEMPAAESVVAMSADSTLTSEHEAEHSNSDSSDSIKADNASAQEAGAGTVIEGGGIRSSRERKLCGLIMPLGRHQWEGGFKRVELPPNWWLWMRSDTWMCPQMCMYVIVCISWCM